MSQRKLAVKIYEDLLPELRKILDQCNNPKAEMVYHYTISEEKRFLEHYKEALEHIQFCIELAENYPKMISSLQKGNFYFRKGIIYYENLVIDEAQKAFATAVELYPPKRLNTYQAQKYLAFLDFLSGNLEKCIHSLSQLISENNRKLLPLHTNLCEVNLCVAHYCARDLKNAWKLLPSFDFFLNDKGGFHAIYRILEILFLIEREDFEQTTLKIDSYRKYLKKYHQHDRFEIIYQIFNQLEYLSYDYVKLMNEEIFTKLMNTRWEPLTSETIHVGLWVQSKAKNIDYYQLFLQWVQKEWKKAIVQFF